MAVSFVAIPYSSWGLPKGGLRIRHSLSGFRNSTHARHGFASPAKRWEDKSRFKGRFFRSRQPGRKWIVWVGR